MKYLIQIAVILFLVTGNIVFSQEVFNGINYQSIIKLKPDSKLKLKDFDKIQFEFYSNKGMFYDEVILLSEVVDGKVDVVISSNNDFSNKLLDHSITSDIIMKVYYHFDGQYYFAEERELKTIPLSNFSKFNIIAPKPIELSDVIGIPLNDNQILKRKGEFFENYEDKVSNYSVLTSTNPDVYSYANKSDYSIESDSSTYSDTALVSGLSLYDFAITGNDFDSEALLGTIDNQDLSIKTNNVNRLHLNQSNNLMINSPSLNTANISINGTSGFLSTHNFGLGNSPVINASSIFLFSAKTSSLRFGNYSADFIDEDTIGNYSFAFGKNNISNGSISSTVFGEECIVDSIPPITGSPTLYDGSAAFAFGYRSNASGRYSVAIGYESEALMMRGVAIGYKAKVDSSSAALALGYQASCFGATAAAIGYNVLTNSAKSFSLGNYASTNKMAGSFVYGDISTTDIVENTSNNQFLVRASGGFRFMTDANLTSGVELTAGSGSWSSLSDKHSKNHIVKLNSNEYLSSIDDLSIYEWEYKSEYNVNHIGVMAQNFHNTFNLGTSSRHITMVDADGVNLLLTKGIIEKYSELENKIYNLNKEVLNIDFSDSEDRLNIIEQKLNIK